MEKKHIREIVFDTETTGFNFKSEDRIIEIGAIELIDRIPTGKTFRALINPEMKISEKSIEVHKITDSIVADKPKFKEIADDWLEFLGTDYMLVAHNATFDMNFLNMEFERIGYPPISKEKVIDTLLIAQKKFPNSRNSLDALCKRYNISLEKRESEGHGALLDSEILADVYIELIGANELVFGLEEESIEGEKVFTHKKINIKKRIFKISDEDNRRHIDFMKKLNKNYS